MNNFIHASNQATLWKVINGVASVNQYFFNAPPGAKEKWFQSHIGHMYQMYYGKQESVQSLNKKAIDLMLGSLQPPMQPPMQPSMQPPLQPSLQPPLQPPMQPPMQPPLQPYKIEPTLKTPMDEFSRRQAEYDALIKKPVPVANFADPIKDEAILDINSALEQYKRLRTDEPVDKPIEIQIEELPVEKKHVQWGERHVQWGENQEREFNKNDTLFETRFMNAIQNLEKDIAVVKTQIAEILDIIKNKT